MELQLDHPWPSTEAEALALQQRLRPLVRPGGPDLAAVRTLAGLDVAYGGSHGAAADRVAAAVVVLDADTLEVVDRATAVGTAGFPYPGLFAFRELPILAEALARLGTVPDVLLCDGQGLAHPRRFGLACHLGLLTGRPTLGVAKTPLLGSWDEPGPARGDRADVRHEGELVARVLRTQTGVKPVTVSIGHLITLDDACELTLRAAPRYRLPETTRLADRLCRDVLEAG